MSEKTSDEVPSVILEEQGGNLQKMRVNNAGQWSGAIEQNKFDLFSIISEGLNNIEHSDSVEIDIKLGKLRIEGEIYRAYSLIESGGCGFGDRGKFIEAITWGSSNKSGLNNFGTGFKCECMIRQKEDDSVYKVMKIDTGISCGISWSSDGLIGDIPKEKELPEDYIKENFPAMSKRVTLAVWGKNSDKLNEKVLIQNMHNITPDDSEVPEEEEGIAGDKEDISSLLNRRYGRCPSKISYNGSEIKDDGSFDEGSAKIHICIPEKKMFDTMNIKFYEINGKHAIKCTPNIIFHAQQGEFWIKTAKKTKLQQSPPIWIKGGEPKAEITMQIMEHNKNMFTQVKYNVHCEMSGPEGEEGIILSEEKWDSDWGKGNDNPIHLLLKGKGEWLNLTANKTRSHVKEELMDLISTMVNLYYLTGEPGHPTAPAFHKLKTKKTVIPKDVRNDEIENIKEWQGEQEYFKERKEEEFFHCMCCHGLISEKSKDKMNQCEMGHIEAAHEKKEKGEEDDVSQRNLVPICFHCNKNMGTTNMTEYIKKKFGRKSDNYKFYKQYCEKKGKMYLPRDIKDREIHIEF